MACTYVMLSLTKDFFIGWFATSQCFSATKALHEPTAVEAEG